MLRKLENPPTKTCSAMPFPGIAMAVTAEGRFFRSKQRKSVRRVCEDTANELGPAIVWDVWGKNTDAWTATARRQQLKIVLIRNFMVANKRSRDN